MATTAMTNSYLSLTSSREFPIFHARLGLCVIDLAADADRPPATEAMNVIDRVIRVAIASSDAYTAQNVLKHPICRTAMSAEDERSLATMIKTSRLRSGTISNSLLHGLLAVASTSETELKAALSAQTP